MELARAAEPKQTPNAKAPEKKVTGLLKKFYDLYVAAEITDLLQWQELYDSYYVAPDVTDLLQWEELYDLFYVAAYGCNRDCGNRIRKVFHDYERDNPLFAFYEFFTTQPIPFWWSSEDDKPWKQFFLLAPFAPRLAQHGILAPKYDVNAGKGKVKLCFRNEINFHDEPALALRMDKGHLIREALENLSASQGITITKSRSVKWDVLLDKDTGAPYKIGFIDKFKFRDLEEDYSNLLVEDATSKIYGQTITKLLEPMFVDNKDKNVPGLFVPIASSRFLYGGVWIILPGLNPKKGEDKTFRKAVADCIAKTINVTYLPVLGVLHEHWLEKLYSKWNERKGNQENVPLGPLEKKFYIKVFNPNGRCDNTITFDNVYLEIDKRKSNKKCLNDIAYEIECRFYGLWERRNKEKEWNKRENFKNSLIFKNYVVCSESMVKLLCDVINKAKNLGKTNDTLPACIVVGGPGSGKDKLAKMIRLFSGEGNGGNYYKGEEFVVNLASIRPAPLTAAVMVGVQMDNQPFNFNGILQQIRSPRRGQRSCGNKEHGHPTLILDEFNSMDPDSQGVLLRFLDNSEIIAVGALKDTKGKDDTNCLVIGIMNEDPEEISRERAMEFLSSPYIGGLLSDLLYEHFMRIRRLRPDVMYRMIRNGKFIIPALAKRREDIPLLFYVFVKQELDLHKNKGQTIRLRLPLDVLDRLVAPDISWPGNIRQLQALAKVVAEKLSRKFKDEPILGCVVDLNLLNEALQEEFLMASN